MNLPVGLLEYLADSSNKLRQIPDAKPQLESRRSNRTHGGQRVGRYMINAALLIAAITTPGGTEAAEPRPEIPAELG